MLLLSELILSSDMKFGDQIFMMGVENGLQFPSFQAIYLEFLQADLLRQSLVNTEPHLLNKRSRCRLIFLLQCDDFWLCKVRIIAKCSHRTSIVLFSKTTVLDL